MRYFFENFFFFILFLLLWIEFQVKFATNERVARVRKQNLKLVYCAVRIWPIISVIDKRQTVPPKTVHWIRPTNYIIIAYFHNCTHRWYLFMRIGNNTNFFQFMWEKKIIYNFLFVVSLCRLFSLPVWKSAKKLVIFSLSFSVLWILYSYFLWVCSPSSTNWHSNMVFLAIPVLCVATVIPC